MSDSTTQIGDLLANIAIIVGHTNGAQLRRRYKQTRPEAESRISRVYASL